MTSTGVPTPKALEATAVAVACEAAELVAEAANSERPATGTKSSANDLVTEVDLAAEALIVGRLGELRPGDGVLGEEGAAIEGTTGVRWVIDPIDGTTNFVYRLPGFAVSVAAEVDGEVVAGAVVDPTVEAVFRAHLGGPASRNDVTLEMAPPPPLETALVGTGFGPDPERRRRQAHLVARMLPEVRDIRRRGAAATDLCGVACGELDAFYEEGLNRWDFAAAALIVRCAGGLTTDLAGGNPTPEYVVAAAPGLHEVLRLRLSALGAAPAPD